MENLFPSKTSICGSPQTSASATWQALYLSFTVHTYHVPPQAFQRHPDPNHLGDRFAALARYLLNFHHLPNIVQRSLEAHKIHTVTTVEELDEILQDHHHRFVVVFCLTPHYKDPGVDEEGWYHHYERLNNMHFVRVNLDESEELEQRLKPRVKPSWVTFHRGNQTGCASGGMKKFVLAHSERRHSTSI